MLSYLRILVLCTFGGYLFSVVFMASGSASAGAVKGLLVGMLVVWAEWKSMSRKAEALEHSRVF